MVLAASVNLDAIAIVGNNDKNTIELLSEGYSPLSISLDNIAVNEAEFGTTSALIKGVIAGMNDHGYKTGPFKAYVTSDVLNGAVFLLQQHLKQLSELFFQVYITI